MFREVNLPQAIKGRLYLHRMLGRGESLSTEMKEIDDCKIGRVLSLASLEEIETHSPDYFQIIQSQDNQWGHVLFPIPDFQVPSDKVAFINLLMDEADFLRNGGILLVHCRAGLAAPEHTPFANLWLWEWL